MPRKPNNDQSFIERLHRYISQPSYSFIEWVPQNKGFIINDEKAFTSQILQKKFGIGRFDSFIRKLNKFGFKRSRVSKSKIRFFHKQFTKDSKSISNIKKLTKEQALPKHIKLRMMRQKLGSDSGQEIQRNQEKEKQLKIQGQQKQIKKQEFQKQTGCEKSRSLYQFLQASQRQDISIYLVKQSSQRNMGAALQKL